jgi:putative membrane protein
MALAFGHGLHMGFGLGFLNLLGTVLFFMFFLMALKFFFRLRHSGNESDWVGPDWRRKAYQRYRSWAQDSEGLDRNGHKRHRVPDEQVWSHINDEAMQVARERLANGELSPEAFETIKQGLLGSETSEAARDYRLDSALSICRLRFAKGELSLEEFEAVKKALS